MHSVNHSYGYSVNSELGAFEILDIPASQLVCTYNFLAKVARSTPDQIA